MCSCRSQLAETSRRQQRLYRRKAVINPLTPVSGKKRVAPPVACSQLGAGSVVPSTRSFAHTGHPCPPGSLCCDLFLYRGLGHSTVGVAKSGIVSRYAREKENFFLKIVAKCRCSPERKKNNCSGRQHKVKMCYVGLVSGEILLVVMCFFFVFFFKYCRRLVSTHRKICFSVD